MARVVIDTNVHLRHLLKGMGNDYNSKALSLAYGYHNPLQSEETFEELKEVLHRPKLQSFLDPSDRRWLLSSIRKRAEFVDHDLVLEVSPDPKDNMFFALAKAGEADYIISNDKRDVISVQDFPSKAITPKDFVDPENDEMQRVHKAMGYKWFKNSHKVFLPDGCDPA